RHRVALGTVAATDDRHSFRQSAQSDFQRGGNIRAIGRLRRRQCLTAGLHEPVQRGVDQYAPISFNAAVAWRQLSLAAGNPTYSIECSRISRISSLETPLAMAPLT